MNIKCFNCGVDVPAKWVKEFGTCDSCERPLKYLSSYPKLNYKIDLFFEENKNIIDLYKSGKTVQAFLVASLIELGYDPATALTIVKAKLK